MPWMEVEEEDSLADGCNLALMQTRLSRNGFTEDSGARLNEGHAEQQSSAEQKSG